MEGKCETETLLSKPARISFQKKHTPNKAQKRKRLVTKNGTCNIYQSESKKQRIAFLQFDKLADSSWCFTLLILVATLLTSWFIFAVIYWLICFTHGDFEPNHLPEYQRINNFTPCIYDMKNFASCFHFSLETQHTVGYGIKAPTDECPEAIFVNALQCILGFIMQGFMAVIIFTKMTLPRRRSKTLLFSKNATICPRNNETCLMFRIGDMRKNHIIDSNVRAFFVRSESTSEGHILPHRQTELLLSADGCKNNLFFNWPLVVVHKINETSPLYGILPSDLLDDDFEIVVVLEGTIQSTGQMTQAMTSYMSSEIIWGGKFQNLAEFNYYRGAFEVDFSKFDQVTSVTTPLSVAGTKY